MTGAHRLLLPFEDPSSFEDEPTEPDDEELFAGEEEVA